MELEKVAGGRSTTCKRKNERESVHKRVLQKRREEARQEERRGECQKAIKRREEKRRGGVSDLPYARSMGSEG